MQIEAGTILDGKVTGIAAFGAFVELPGGKTGLVHISEVSTDYVNDVKDFLKEGQSVKVKVISVENGKISLSVKQAVQKPQSTEKPEKKRGGKRHAEKKSAPGSRKPPEEFSFGERATDMSLEDMLQKFKKDSDERFQDLKRSNESKRSGGYKRSY